LITWSPSHLITSQKSAFTLAEVLITLAIIGVVAAMTIPTLVANYQTRAWNTSATVFERKLEEALKVMNTQSTLAGHTSTENFVEELSKHLKITKTCANDKLMDCFSETVYWGGGDVESTEVKISDISTAEHFGQKNWGTNIVGVQLANGSSALIAYNPTESCKQDPYSNQINGANCLAILYDTSGFKLPNASGKDLRANGNVSSLGAAKCAYEVDGLCFGLAFSPGVHEWKACNGEGTSTDPEDLAFMQQYGIEHCSGAAGPYDFWAGAIEACGGINKIPSLAQLAKLSEKIYPDIASFNTNFEGVSTCPDGAQCMQEDIVTKLGIKMSGEDGTLPAIWSRDFMEVYPLVWLFEPTGTGVYYYAQNGAEVQAICLK